MGERVAATLSAELVVALAQQGGPDRRSEPPAYEDAEPPDEEDELNDEQYESGPENGSPRYRRGRRGPSPDDEPSADPEGQTKQEKGGPAGEVQVMIVEGPDGEAFPIPLRARKGKAKTVGAPAAVSGVKRKR